MGLEKPWVFLFFSSRWLGLRKTWNGRAFWSRSFDQLSAVGSFLLTPLLYLGGVFFSIESLHPFWQSLAKFNPLLYLINGVRHGVLG